MPGDVKSFEFPDIDNLSLDLVLRVSIPKPRRSLHSGSDSGIKLPKLMQRVGAEPGKAPTTTSWFEESQPAFCHQAEYLNRLRKLRQDLIDHEHRKLSNALDKFRLKDKESTFYLGQRIPGRAVFKLHAHNALPARAYTNTAERFRKSKHEETRHIETVQGRQLLEPQLSTEDISTPHRVSLNRSEIDLTVKENLKRLLQPQPSCSIPNIGRRTLKHVSLEKSNSIEIGQKSPRGLNVHRSQTHHKFPLATGLRESKKHLTRPDSDELDLSPMAVKFKRTDPRDILDRVPGRFNSHSYDVFYVPSTPDAEKTYAQRYRCTCDALRSVKTGAHSKLNDQNIANCCCKVTDVHFPNIGEERSPRRRIVVDMPDIILYPASPDIHSGGTSTGGQLVKTLKQNQLRQREITNLLEDVKELKNRTESLEASFTDNDS